MNTTRFDEMNLSSEMMKALTKKGFEEATSVQADTIPAMMDWRDVIAKAPTGTGKTFAFGIPLIEHIDTNNHTVQALILAPTRELAIQICTEMRSLAQFRPGLRMLSIYGGQSMGLQLQGLKKYPKIIVATPGRLIDHINRGTIKLDNVQTVVLDEADRMVDMGFYKDVTKILDLMPNIINMALLSATISREVMTIGWTYQRDAVEVTVPQDVQNKPDIIQYSIKIPESQKIDAISRIIKSENSERSIVFCNTKRKVMRITELLIQKGYNVDCIHGDVRQSIREKVLGAFRNGKLNILVATDVAARGIDVDDVDTIFNYDIPMENEYYVHRIGRTGRAKKHGTSYTFISSLSDSIRLDEIAKYTRSKISTLSIDATK